MTDDLLILGTDTDAGKTTFAALWLSAFPTEYEYWKPVETGEADSERIRRWVPAAVVHPSLKHFPEAVAPLLAARTHGQTIPASSVLAARKPIPPTGRALLVETFGSPFSPLNENELQISLVERLGIPAVVVTSSAVGAVGRMLQSCQALRVRGIEPIAAILVGTPDAFALEQIKRHLPGMHAVPIEPPRTWSAAGIAAATASQRDKLQRLRDIASPRSADGGRDLQQRDQQAVWHPYTSLRDPDPPLECIGAQDEFLHLADGRRIIDGISSWWTILHGHRHPALMGALRAAQKKFDHVAFAGLTHEPAVALAELLLESAPWRNGKVFYSDNGSTAVEVALKMAYQFWCHQGQPERTLFVGFQNGYHGDTFGAMAAGRDPVFFGTFEPLLFRAEIVPVDVERLEEMLARHKNKIAAVILEPLVQGAGGMRMHSPEVLRRLFEVTRNHGVLFIADEVMTGGGRLGTLWAHQQAGIAPDLICTAKTLTGGVMPLAATLVAPHLVAAWDTDDRTRTFFHGHSFTAHPLACAVAVENWQILSRGVPDAPHRFERFWTRALADLAKNPRVREVRIRGSIAAVEVNVPGGYLADISRQMRLRCLEQAVLLRPLGNVLYAMPPFCTSQKSLERIAEAMRNALS